MEYIVVIDTGEAVCDCGPSLLDIIMAFMRTLGLL